MTYKLLPSVFALVFWTSTVKNKSERQFIDIEIIEASLIELQKVGLIDSSLPFNERAFKNEDFFPNYQKIPDSIGRLIVVPLEFIFTNQEGIALNSINQKMDTYAITFWDYESE